VTGSSARGRPQDGPPLPVPVIAYGVLMIAAVALSSSVPHPGAAAATVLSYDQSHQTVMRVSGMLAFAASVPLGIWSAAVYQRLRTLGINAPGAVIGLCGGLLAAASLGLSGLIAWTTAQLGDTNNPAVARALADLGYAVGSAGFVVPLGLLLAGVAVPALIVRLTARALAWAGLVVAALSMLATLTLLTPALDATLPAGRFAGLVWLVIISFALPQTRHQVPRNSPRLERSAA
jgi:hypothetical protein